MCLVILRSVGGKTEEGDTEESLHVSHNVVALREQEKCLPLGPKQCHFYSLTED